MTPDRQNSVDRFVEAGQGVNAELHGLHRRVQDLSDLLFAAINDGEDIDRQEAIVMLDSILDAAELQERLDNYFALFDYDRQQAAAQACRDRANEGDPLYIDNPWGSQGLTHLGIYVQEHDHAYQWVVVRASQLPNRLVGREYRSRSLGVALYNIVGHHQGGMEWAVAQEREVLDSLTA